LYKYKLNLFAHEASAGHNN